jgi:hypothetical protein
MIASPVMMAEWGCAGKRRDNIDDFTIGLIGWSYKSCFIQLAQENISHVMSHTSWVLQTATHMEFATILTCCAGASVRNGT